MKLFSIALLTLLTVTTIKANADCTAERAIRQAGVQVGDVTQYSFKHEPVTLTGKVTTVDKYMIQITDATENKVSIVAGRYIGGNLTERGSVFGGLPLDMTVDTEEGYLRVQCK